MNKKGFTLIELLAVIVVLGVVFAITIPTMTNLVGKFKIEKRIEMLKNSAISAAKQYVVDGNLDASSVDCEDNTIYLSDIINAKYLDNDEYYEEKTITVFYDCDNKKFTEYTFND